MATPAFSATSTPQPAAQAAPSPVTAEIASLFANAVYGPTQPSGPTTPFAPNPLTEALWAAYRQSASTTSAPSPTAVTQTSQPAPTTGTGSTVVTTIPVDPYQIALSPDGTSLYGTSSPFQAGSTNQPQGSVEVVDTSTNTQVGDPIPVGYSAESVALNPVTKRAYVTAIQPYSLNYNGQQVQSYADSLVVIDTSNNKVIGTPILLASQHGTTISYAYGSSGQNVAVSPDGSRVYVSETTISGDMSNPGTATIQPTVYVFDTKTNTLVGSPIPVGPASTSPQNPVFGQSILVSPSGDRLYATTVALTNTGSAGPTYTSTIYSINPTTGAAAGNPIVVDGAVLGFVPGSAALSPDGKKLYVESLSQSAPSSSGSNLQVPNATVSTYDTSSGKQIGTPIDLTGFGPISVSPDGKTLYVADISDSRTGKTGTLPGSSQPVPEGSITTYDATTGKQIGNPATVGLYPTSLAINSAGTKLYVANAADNTISVINITPVNPNTGNPLQLATGAVIAINSFVQAANTAFGQFLSSAFIGGNTFVQAANTSVAQVVKQVSQQVAQTTSTVNAQANQSLQFALSVLHDFVSHLIANVTSIVNQLHDAIFGNGRPRSSTPTFELYDHLRNVTDGAPNGIAIETFTSGGQKRMVVYLGGTTLDLNNQFVLKNNPSYQGQLDGEQTKKVLAALNGDKTVKIMLVGFSQGGMDAQNMAAKASFKNQVTTVVTFASPVVEKASNYQNGLHYVDIWDKGDVVPHLTFPIHQSDYNSVASHVFERQSSNDSAFVYNIPAIIPFTGPFVYASNKLRLHGDRSTYEQVADTFDQTAGFSDVKSDIHKYFP